MCSAHSGKPLLIVEDEWLVAASMVDALQGAGYDIAGPVSRPRDALRLIASREIAGALLDINLRGEQSFSIADELVQRGVPFVFLSGYDSRDLPERFHGAPLLAKPVSLAQLLQAVASF